MGKKRKLFNCLIYLIYMVLGSAVFFGIKGYGMYREAIKEEPIDLRIEKNAVRRTLSEFAKNLLFPCTGKAFFDFQRCFFPEIQKIIRPEGY